LAKDGVLVVSGGGTATSGAIGWGKVTGCGGLSISTFFELRDGAAMFFIPASAWPKSGEYVRLRDSANS